MRFDECEVGTKTMRFGYYIDSIICVFDVMGYRRTVVYVGIY